MNSEIKDLLKFNCIKEVCSPPHVVNPLTVSVNDDGKQRLILDLRHVNKHIPHAYVKYDDWRVFENFVTIDGWNFKFDLKKGYHHFDMHPDVQKYLGFAWVIDNTKRYFVFTVLVFGLSPAPRIFTKMLRPLTSYWRGLGIKIAVYIDDGAGSDKDNLLARQHSKQVKNTLIQAGFVVNTEKSIWEPARVMTWLGITLDTVTNEYYIPHNRVVKIKTLITHLLSSPYTTARKIAQLVGSIIL